MMHPLAVASERRVDAQITFPTRNSILSVAKELSSMELGDKEKLVHTCQQERMGLGYILYLQQLCRLGTSTRLRFLSAIRSEHVEPMLHRSMDAMSALQTPVHCYTSERASGGSNALLTKRCFLFAGRGPCLYYSAAALSWSSLGKSALALQMCLSA